MRLKYLVDERVGEKDYYPGGMLMPGRNFSNNSYRYGMMGYEKDDEVKGSENSYNMGERLYDPRLIRVHTIDPLAKQFPSESPYGFAGNNPIYFIDEDGKKKTSYITVIDKKGNKSTFIIVDDKKVMTEVVGYSYVHSQNHPLDFHFDYQKHPITQDYDINEYVTIDFSQGGEPTLTTSGELKGKERNWYTKAGEWIDENIATGGMAMSSSSGEGGAAEGKGDGRIMNIDDLLGVVGTALSAAKSGSPFAKGQAKEFLQALGGLAEANAIGGALRDAFGIGYEDVDKGDLVCPTCYRTDSSHIDGLHGKGTFEKLKKESKNVE